MSSDVDKIKERLSVDEVVGSYVELQQAGKYLKGKSPFTNESDPSFYVSPEKGLYHCFSSGKGGDIFTFVQEMEGVEFRGALEILADRAGVKLTGSAKQNKKKQRLREIMEEAVEFYAKLRKDNKAIQNYLRKRGIKENTAEEFRLGYSPDEWRVLLSHLKDKGYKVSEIIEAGLAKQPDNNKSPYDRFRNRLLFPISDTAGRVIAFSGRRIDDEKETAKYINSPETSLFKKKRTLFGFSRAKNALRELDAAIIVEGQTDLLLAHQAGFKNTVAGSGTSITREHLKLLQRFTDNLILALDTDTAGRESTMKTARLALKAGMTPKVAGLPDGKDPADLISESGSEAFREVIKNSVDAIDAAVDWTKQATSGRQNFLKSLQQRVFPLLASIKNEITRDHFITRVAQQADIREQTLRSEMNKYHKQINANSKNFSDRSKQATDETAQSLTQGERKDRILKQLLVITAWQNSLDSPVIDSNNIEERIISICQLDDSLSYDQTVSDEDVFAVELFYQSADEEDVAKDVEELLLHLEEQALSHAYGRAKRQMSKVEDQKTKQKWLKKCQDISQKIHAVREKIQKHP